MGYIAKSFTPSFINIFSNMNFSFSIKRGIYFPFLNLNLLMTWLWPIKHNGSDMPVPSPGLRLSCIFSLFLLELCPAAMRTCLSESARGWKIMWSRDKTLSDEVIIDQPIPRWPGNWLQMHGCAQWTSEKLPRQAYSLNLWSVKLLAK